MQRIVSDTNSLIQCLPSKSIYHPIWQSFFDGTNLLCVSTGILNEYEEILCKLTSEEIARAVVDAIINNPYTIYIDPRFKLNLITKDPDDNMFVDCAFASNAKYIVTNDHHFDILKTTRFPQFEVMTIQKFLLVYKG